MGVRLQDNICPILCKKMFEDAKGVIRNRKSKKYIKEKMHWLIVFFPYFVMHTEFAFPAF
jgi:hypothetical protein